MTYGGYSEPDPFGSMGRNPTAADPLRGTSPGFGAPPPPYPPASYPVPVKTNSLSTLSLVFAFVFAPAGAVLGHLGLSQIARTGQRGRDRALIGLVLSYAVIVIIATSLVVWTVSGRTPRPALPPVTGLAPAAPASTSPSVAPAPPLAPLVTAEGLVSLLLTIDDVKQLVNAPNLNNTKDDTKVFDAKPSAYSPSECATVFAAYELLTTDPLAAAVGTMAVQDRALDGPAPSTSGVAFVEETVVRVNSAATANTFVSGVIDRWRGCAGKTVTSDPGSADPMSVNVEQPITSGAVTMLHSNYVNGVSLERAVASKENVIIEISASVGRATDEVLRLAQAIAGRVPG